MKHYTKPVNILATHWTITQPNPIPHNKPGSLWAVQCNYCDVQSFRTTTSINADFEKCECRASNRRTVLLKVEAFEKTVAEWKTLYPSVNPQTVYNNLSKRKTGIPPYSTWTDAQCLFGKFGCPDRQRTVAKLEEGAADSRSLTNEFILNLSNALTRVVEEAVNEKLYPLVLNARKASQVKSTHVIGSEYYLETAMSTIGECLDSDMDAEQLKEFIGYEDFETLEKKKEQLSSYIPVDDRYLYITELEYLALLSIGHT